MLLSELEFIKISVDDAYNGTHRREGKMSSILEEFARGNIDPHNGSIRRGSTYDKTLKALVENENKLSDGLDGELAEIFKQYVDLQGEVQQMDGRDKFIYGYRLGVLMTVEVFTGNRDAIYSELN